MNPLLHTDRHEFSGIDTHFQTRMMPDIMKYEAERKTRMRWGLCVAVLLLLPSLWLSWYLIFQYDGSSGRVYFAAFIIPVAIPYLGGLLVTWSSRRSYKAYVMSNITWGLGWRHKDRVIGWKPKLREKPHALIKTLSDFGVLPRHTQRIVDDTLEGPHLGKYFKLREVFLFKHKWRATYYVPTVIFQGLVTSFQLDRITPDTTIISRSERPSLSRFARGKYYFGEYEDAQGSVHILSTDHDVLSTVMCVRFRSAIADLEAAFPNANMACLLSGNQLHVTMKAKNRFEIGSMFDAWDSPAHVQKMLDEFGDILKLLDIILARRRCPKTGEVAAPHFMS